MRMECPTCKGTLMVEPVGHNAWDVCATCRDCGAVFDMMLVTGQNMLRAAAAAGPRPERKVSAIRPIRQFGSSMGVAMTTSLKKGGFKLGERVLVEVTSLKEEM